MDFDSVIEPAFTIASTPGAYAVLLGAGVSKSSGVPSAWDVQVDLIQRVAAIHGEMIVEDDALGWWTKWAGEEPTYGGVLRRLASSPHERQALLRAMFEPDEVDREQGRKQPSAAHRALAELVASGHLRVIVTTNFDLLMEQAIRDLGIEPYVVADAAAAAGLPPLHTLPALVVHLHGDYLNPATMLNTETELEAYTAEMGSLLGDVLSNHGLMIAGWSATWDTALRAAIGSQSRRFYSPIWIEPFELSDLAQRLATSLGARQVTAGADDSLPALAEAVAALSSRKSRHPLLPTTVVEAVKRAVAGRASAVDLHDLLRTEFERLRSTPGLELSEGGSREGDVLSAEEAVRAAADVPTAAVAAAAYWGDDLTDRLWFDELDRYTRQARGGGYTRLLTLRRIAGSQLFYAAGVAAVARGRYDLAIRLVTAIVTTDDGTGGARLSRLLSPTRSALLYERLRDLFEVQLMLGPERYEEAWERFEYLQLMADVNDKRAFADFVGKAFVTNESTGTEERISEPEWSEGLRKVASFVQPHGRHIRSQDHMPKWWTFTGRRLLNEVRIQGYQHVLVLNNFGSPIQLEVAIEAVEVAVGELAESVSWRHLSPGTAGMIPSLVWIDDEV